MPPKLPAPQRSPLDSSRSTETPWGASPRPSPFAAGQPHSINCWYVGHVANGIPQLSNNGKATCGSLPS